MLYEAKHGILVINGEPQPQGTRGALFRTDTNQKIPFARYADTDTGEWQAWASTPDGEMENPPRLLKGKCPIKFVVSYTPVIASEWKMPKIAKRKAVPTQSPKQAAAEIRTIARDYGFTEIIQIPGQTCEYPGCRKLASWSTADERIIDPAPGGFERAFATKVHRYCSDPRHWRPPIRTSIRGVQSEVEVETSPHKK
jgi:hypothetical protein